MTTALEFHQLEIEDVDQLTDDAVAVTMAVPPDLRETFRYLPGQHVTLRAFVDHEDVRRSYSICANANRGTLRVGIKKLGGGAFSTWATSSLQPGETVDVMPPVGEFTITPDPDAANHYGAIAAGSGITPILSLIATTLDSEPNSRWTLVFGNKAARTIMFLDELAGLKDRYLDRFHLVHILSREQPEIPLFGGRIDRRKLRDLFDTIIDRESVDAWYLCGPFEMVQAARQLLEGEGVPLADLHDELFFAGPLDLSELPSEPEHHEGTVELRLTLEGRSSTVRMRPETAILDAALNVRRELPFSCKGGMCASCKAKLVSGKVEMDKNYALVQSDLEAGFILTCQSHPTTDEVVVDYDQR